MTNNWNLSDRSPTCLKMKICNRSSKQWNLNHFTHSNPPFPMNPFFFSSSSTNPTPQWADWGRPCLATHWCEVWCMGGGWVRMFLPPRHPGILQTRATGLQGAVCIWRTNPQVLFISLLDTTNFSDDIIHLFRHVFPSSGTNHTQLRLQPFKERTLVLKNILCACVPFTTAQVPRVGKVVYQVLQYLPVSGVCSTLSTLMPHHLY